MRRHATVMLMPMVVAISSGRTFAGEPTIPDTLAGRRASALIAAFNTGGGAHPVSFLTLNKYFILKIPDGRAINPVTKTNWEGVGVIPHVEVPADQAKEKAYQLALQRTKADGSTASTE